MVGGLRRLEEGSLLSFIWVQDSGVQHIFLSVSEKVTEATEEYGLANHRQLGYINVNLVTQDRSTFQILMQANSYGANGVLIEYPNIMPATFVPILESLQAMQRLNRLPFQRYIVPDKNEGGLRTPQYHQVPPPLYARKAGFTFPLESLTTGAGTSPCINPDSSCDDAVLISALETSTPLDRGQCQALIAALPREFAFIQGPPGTGKSYLGLQIMKVLMDIKIKANLDPILIV